MNYRIIASHTSRIVIAIGLLMIPSMVCAAIYREWHALTSLFISMGVVCAFGGLLWLAGRNAPSELFQREALGLVAGAWIIAAAAGGAPYVVNGDLGPVDAYFESASGFTTTGATVIVDIEAVDKSILFWRSFTHWLGGIGIIVLFIAVLPYIGAGGKQLIRSESSGLEPRGLRPRVRDTASTLYKIYFGMTIVQTGLLMLAGMSLYDALCHTFSTLSTGGFSPKQESVGYYDNAVIEAIVIFFMIAAGTNFSLYFAMLRKNHTALFRSTEWRAYIALMAGVTVFATAILTVQGTAVSGGGLPVDAALRTSAFQAVSLVTGTGFVSDDYQQWPLLLHSVLITVMFIGGCAGSTCGGMKVGRLVLLIKMVYWRLECLFRPKTVRVIRLNDETVDEDAQRMVYAFFVLVMGWFAIGCAVMAGSGLEFETGVSAVVATLNNVGPGFGGVGATQDYHHIPGAGKAFLSLCMIAGRLEFFCVTVLLLPSFWRHT